MTNTKSLSDRIRACADKHGVWDDVRFKAYDAMMRRRHPELFNQSLNWYRIGNENAVASQVMNVARFNQMMTHPLPPLGPIPVGLPRSVLGI